MYYDNKIEILRDIFGADVVLDRDVVQVGAAAYPIIDDVIVVLPPDRYPASVAARITGQQAHAADCATAPFSPAIQQSFGAEWQSYPAILPEHETEFRQYFDVVDLEGLRGKRICDLGCGIGRWSYFLAPYARQLILVDFSEAIFVARHNLRELSAAVFVMGDLTALPFRRRFADFAMCVGVLHHLPINALEGVKIIARYAPELLVYLYSALDGRPWLYRQLFRPVDLIRRLTCRIRSEATRRALTWFGLFGLYLPMLVVGYLAKPFGLEKSVPLFEFYSAKSWKRIRQDVYDRFFTSIEQRFSWCQIQTLGTDFDSLVISTGIPRWHFVCRAKD